MNWDSPQHKAARASAVARKQRADQRKERARRQAAAPICAFCQQNQSAVGVTVDDKPICGPCLKDKVYSR